MEVTKGETWAIFVDPFVGKETRQRFAEFFHEFEDEARLIVAYRPKMELPIQILHLPEW